MPFDLSSVGGTIGKRYLWPVMTFWVDGYQNLDKVTSGEDGGNTGQDVH